MNNALMTGRKEVQLDTLSSEVDFRYIDAKTYDSAIETILFDQTKLFREDQETAHMQDGFKLHPRSMLQSPTETFCEDKVLDQKLKAELAHNRKLYKDLEAQLQAERQEQPTGNSTPSLLQFLLMDNSSIDKEFDRVKETKYIDMFEANTNKVMEFEQSIANKRQVVSAMYSNLEKHDLFDQSGLINIEKVNKQIQIDPQIAHDVRMAMASTKALTTELINVSDNVLDKDTLSVCSKSASNDLKVALEFSNMKNPQEMKNMNNLFQELAPKLDKKHVGNLLDDTDEATKEANKEAMRKFGEQFSKIISRFFSNESNINSPAPK